MIDIITTELRDLKHVTQIGTPNSDEKIYIEDSAYARIHIDELQERRVFILMGYTQHTEGNYTSFVEAVIPVCDIRFEGNVPVWTNLIWNEVFREIRRQFENLIVVGWALDLKGISPKMTPAIEAIHREYFGGIHQMLFLINSADNEEYFYLNKNNHLYRKDGFYIYYRSQKKRVPQPADREVPVPVEADRKVPAEIMAGEKDTAAGRRSAPDRPRVRPGGRTERESASANWNKRSDRLHGKYRELLLYQTRRAEEPGRNIFRSVAVLAVVLFTAAVFGVFLSKDPGSAGKVGQILETFGKNVSQRGITFLSGEGTEEQLKETEDGEDSEQETYFPVEKIDGRIPSE